MLAVIREALAFPPTVKMLVSAYLATPGADLALAFTP
jgi:hypothetical protein